MDSQRNTSYTSKMISFPLRSIEKNYAFEELNETGIKIEFVEEGKRNGGLNVFSKIESYGEIEDTDLQKTVAAFLFKNVEKSYRNFSNFISKTKEEFNLTETTLEKIKDTFYQNYGLLFYLKVNICMVNEFHYPETALMPLVMEKKISKDIYDKWPITYVIKDKDGYYQIVKRMTFCTKNKLEIFLNNNISSVYDGLCKSIV